jgi:hypothetical protein
MYRPLLAIVIALAGVEARADLITNGSFESTTPAVGAGTYVLFAPGSTGVTGWTVVGAAGTNIGVTSTTFTQSGISFPAQNGSNEVDLTGLTNRDTEGLQQTIATTIGDSYTLSFFIGNVDSPSTGFGLTSTVDVFANGTSLGAFTNNCTTCTTSWVWQQFSDTFTATSAVTTLTFLNGDPTNDNANGLDSVSLVDNGPATVPAAVPEPFSIVLLGSGLLGLAGWRRLRSA